MNKHVFGLRSGSGVYENVEFDKSAEVFGSPVIKDSHILGGKVFSGRIYESTVRDNAIMAGRVLNRSYLYKNAVISDNAAVYRSLVTDDARILENAIVTDCIITHFAQVQGRAEVRNTRLWGYDFIDRGIWERRPYTYVSKNGFVVTENIGNLVTISCQTNTIEKWFKAGARYGQIIGCPPEEVAEIQGYVETIRDLKNRPDYDMK